MAPPRTSDPVEKTLAEDEAMMLDLVKRHLPEWIEAGTIVLTLVVSAAAAAGVTFYKVDQMADDVKEIKTAVTIVPVLKQRVGDVDEDVNRLENKLDKLEDRLYDIKEKEYASERTD